MHLIDTQSPALETQTAKPETIYLKDYTPPAFLVNTIDMCIQIFATETIVTSTIDMVKNEQANFDGSDDLILFGTGLELLEISLNGTALTESDYELTAEKLTIKNAQTNDGNAKIVTKVRIHPETNTTLEGLYLAGKYEGAEQQDVTGMFVTQCEPEGFRKITFYPDRPDVMAVFTTRLEAPKNLPTLLANGNLVEKGDLDNDRHFAIWHDPTKKPSYLFACVGADLALLKDSYTTSEGREVSLELYADQADIEKCHVAMQALKDSMKWDEEEYGLPYDLDNYMIVATGMFNMGAMENKGLNIFNTACVLSSPEVTTDARNLSVKAIISHEYFHNWTGNRITCRDWFQLCLKEGFTVFRDQSFTTTVQSEAVQRIDDVSMLKARQFPEDAGPLAHPPRPDHFVEINNFYTATVYEKGAEIARMIANLLGKDAFRKGTDSYFKRFDGMAVTVEDLLDALSDSGTDVRHFLDWYTQPATPEVTVKTNYDASANTYTLTLSQETRQVAGYPAPKALPIPVDTALFNADGNITHEQTLMLTEAEQSFIFDNVQAEPKVSLLRNFSAPVNLNYDYSDADLAFLVENETNGFNKWQATQTLVERILHDDHSPAIYINALKNTLPDLSKTDPLLATRLLDIPSENQLASKYKQDYNPQALHNKREHLKKAIASELADFWETAYHQFPISDYVDNSLEMGKRAWRNTALACAIKSGHAQASTWASAQYDNANCMTERLGALQQLVWNDLADADAKLADFYDRFQDDELVIDMWFSVQSGNPSASVVEVTKLLDHDRFDYGVPNRIRSVASHLASHPTKVYTAEGIDFFVNLTKVLDEKNPILGSRLLQVMANWYTLAPDAKAMVKQKLTALQNDVTSKNVVESLSGMIKAG